MKIWIIYDTMYGNNRKIANIMQEQLSTNHEVHVNYAKKVSPKKVIATAPDAVIFGGPRHFGKPSFTIRRWIGQFADNLTSNKNQLKKVAVWETQTEMKDIDLKSESNMECKIYDTHLNLWMEILQRIPTANPPQELLSIFIEGTEEGKMTNAKLELKTNEKVVNFLHRFEQI